MIGRWFALVIINFIWCYSCYVRRTNYQHRLLMMDSKQSSKYCVNEMVPLGTSKEALIHFHETMLQTENQPANSDFVPVKLSNKSSRITAAILNRWLWSWLLQFLSALMLQRLTPPKTKKRTTATVSKLSQGQGFYIS